MAVIETGGGGDVLLLFFAVGLIILACAMITRGGRNLVIALGMLLSLVACESPSIQVKKTPDVAAVRVQNETTKTHIKSFSDQNKETQKSVDKATVTGAKVGEVLQGVKKDLESILEQ